MAVPASLDDLIDALEQQSESVSAYLDRETSEIYVMSNESFDLYGEDELDIDAEDSDEDLLEWQKQERTLVRHIESSGQCTQLPDHWDINEWNILAEFSNQQRSEDVRNSLLSAIRSQGAFRRFRDLVHHLGLETKWQQFRRKAFAQILTDWAENNDIEIQKTTKHRTA